MIPGKILSFRFIIIKMYKNSMRWSSLLCSCIVISSFYSNLFAGSPQKNHSIGPSSFLFSQYLTQDEANGVNVEEKQERPWTVSIPVWVPGYRGRFTVGGVEVEGETGEDNIFDQLFSSNLSLDFYFVGLVNYKWQDWNFHAEIFSGTIGNSAIFTLNDNTVVDAEVNILMPSIYAGYDFLYDSSPIGPVSNWQVYLGGRLYSVDVEAILPGNLGMKNSHTTWFTFLLGTDIAIKVVNRLYVKLSGDIGGLLNSHEPSLFGLGAIHYQPWDLFSVSFGYAAIHIDRVDDKNDNSSEMELKADLAGPVFGIGFHF